MNAPLGTSFRPRAAFRLFVLFDRVGGQILQPLQSELQNAVPSRHVDDADAMKAARRRHQHNVAHFDDRLFVDFDRLLVQVDAEPVG